MSRAKGYKFRWQTALLRRSTLGASERLAAVCLADFGDGNGGNIYPSQTTIAHMMGGKSRSTASRAIGNLVAAGWIAREDSGAGGTCRYRLTLPDGFEHTEEAAADGEAGLQGNPWASR